MFSLAFSFQLSAVSRIIFQNNQLNPSLSGAPINQESRISYFSKAKS
jgi:hypothetical protein